MAQVYHERGTGVPRTWDDYPMLAKQKLHANKPKSVRCHFDEHLEQSGIPVQGSNRGYKPLQLILGLFAGVWCGASCFGHLDVVRYDTALKLFRAS